MGLKLNFDKLTIELDTKKKLSNDEILVRELLEVCSKRTIDYTLIEKLSSRHFFMAQKILTEAKAGNLGPLADLSLSEYVKDNILSTQEIFEYEDDFDVY